MSDADEAVPPPALSIDQQDAFGSIHDRLLMAREAIRQFKIGFDALLDRDSAILMDALGVILEPAIDELERLTVPA